MADVIRQRRSPVGGGGVRWEAAKSVRRRQDGEPWRFMGRFYGFWVFFIDRRPLLVRSGYFSWLGEGLSWTPDAFSGRDVRLVPGGLYWKRGAWSFTSTMSFTTTMSFTSAIVRRTPPDPAVCLEVWTDEAATTSARPAGPGRTDDAAKKADQLSAARRAGHAAPPRCRVVARTSRRPPGRARGAAPLPSCRSNVSPPAGPGI